MSVADASTPAPTGDQIISDAFDKVARTPIRITRLDEHGRRMPGVVGQGLGTVETTTVPMPLWDPARGAELYGRPPEIAFAPRMNTVILMNVRVGHGRPKWTARREALEAFVATMSDVSAASWLTDAYAPHTAMPAWFVEAYSHHPTFGTWALAMPKVRADLKITLSPTRDDLIHVSLRGDLSPNPAVFPLWEFPALEQDGLMVLSSANTTMPEWATRLIEQEREDREAWEEWQGRGP